MFVDHSFIVISQTSRKVLSRLRDRAAPLRCSLCVAGGAWDSDAESEPESEVAGAWRGEGEGVLTT